VYSVVPYVTLTIHHGFYSRRIHHNKKGIDKNWFIDVVDCKTRFMVSSEYVKSRNMKELKSVLKSAKTKTEEQVKIVTSDGLLAYPKAIQKTNIKIN